MATKSVPPSLPRPDRCCCAQRAQAHIMARVRTLFLMRHAKSSWGDPGAVDHDRPLNARGRSAASLMGQWLATKGKVFDTILASTATRAQQTARGVAEASGYQGKILRVRRLYLATPEEILDVASETSDASSSILLIAHNPGLETLVSFWSKTAERFPTATVAEFALPVGDWSDISTSCRARLLGLWRPKELPR